MKSYYNLARAIRNTTEELCSATTEANACPVRDKHYDRLVAKWTKYKDASFKLMDIAKTRDAAPPGIPWVKLSERKPENLERDKNGEYPLYLCWVPSHPGNMRYCMCEWRPRRDTKDGPVYWGFVYDVERWAELNPPEE